MTITVQQFACQDTDLQQQEVREVSRQAQMEVDRYLSLKQNTNPGRHQRITYQIQQFIHSAHGIFASSTLFVIEAIQIRNRFFVGFERFDSLQQSRSCAIILF